MADDTQSRTPGPNKFTKRYLQFSKRYPQVFQAYDALGAATAEAGTVVRQDARPGEIGYRGGRQMEGAVHSHTRRALEAGCSPEGNLPCGLVGDHDAWLSHHDENVFVDG